MKRFFADSYFFLALLNGRDQNHRRVSALAESLRGEVVTTQWVLTEVADGFSKPPLRQLAVELVLRLRRNEWYSVLPVTEAQFEKGFGRYRQRSDKAWSLTDCISIVVMEEEGLTDALTGDRHFEQAGFVAVFAD